MEKEIFVPLTKRWFEAIARGEKTVEYRFNGNRWNEEVCRIGRRMLFSCGYGKSRRIRAVIMRFEKSGWGELPFEVREFYSQMHVALSKMSKVLNHPCPSDPKSTVFASIYFRKDEHE